MYIVVNIIHQKKVNKQEKRIREANNFSIKMYFFIQKSGYKRTKK